MRVVEISFADSFIRNIKFHNIITVVNSIACWKCFIIKNVEIPQEYVVFAYYVVVVF